MAAAGRWRGNSSCLGWLRKTGTGIVLCLALLVHAGRAQENSGELRLRVVDPTGGGVHVSVSLTSLGNNYRKSFESNSAGMLDLDSLHFGIYQLRIAAPGFNEVSEAIEVRSALPVTRTISLSISSVTTRVTVDDKGTLLDPYRPSSAMQIGTDEIEDRVGSLPGRSVQDLVNSQPGWLYEGNAVLHPRGSEYQTQFVVDGLPLTDNRSPGFGPEIEADDVDSVSIYTAGIPAEYGRKMGGVVELNTAHHADPGWHGQMIASGGGYDTAGGFGQLFKTWTDTSFGMSAHGSRTSHYLNPVVPQNFTNDGTNADFSVRYEQDFRENDRLVLAVRHELSRYEIPNELIQQAAGQLQNADNIETMGTASYQHIFSADTLGSLTGMVRSTDNDLVSNEASTPIYATQHNHFLEGYIKATVSAHRGRQEWKFGVESDSTGLHEQFSDRITNPDDFDEGTPRTFNFKGSRPDLEQAAFLEDMIRLNKWTVSAGLRWDHYQLLLNKNAYSPRVSIGRYFPSFNSVLHVSLDRIFQTPSSENLLVSSSPQVVSLNPQVLRLKVQPSVGTYYEGGISSGVNDHLRIDVNLFRRDVNNYADDDQLLNTGISYPIAFEKAILYGGETRVELVRLGKLSGFVSYSYIVGNAWFPVTGGLFLGDDVTSATTQLTGHFPDSQDQRNTLRTRFRYQMKPRIWGAAGLDFGSGLPFDFGGDPSDAVAQYGQQVVDHIDFARGRIDPSAVANASVGYDLLRHDKVSMTFQADGTNLGNRLQVIDFGGLFSGNAIGPARSYGLRLTTHF